MNKAEIAVKYVNSTTVFSKWSSKSMLMIVVSHRFNSSSSKHFTKKLHFTINTQNYRAQEAQREIGSLKKKKRKEA